MGRARVRGGGIWGGLGLGGIKIVYNTWMAPKAARNTVSLYEGASPWVTGLDLDQWDKPWDKPRKKTGSYPV